MGCGPVSGKPLSAGASGGVWLEPLRQLYEGVLEELDYDMDPGYLEALNQLRQRVRQAAHSHQLVDLSPQVRRAVVRFVRQSLAGRDEATAFIAEVLNHLAEVETHLMSSANHTLQLREAGRRLSDSVSTEMVEMGQELSSVQRLDELKTMVRQRLQGMEKVLETFRQEEQQQVKAVSKEMEELRSSLHSVKSQLNQVEQERQKLAQRVRVDPLTGAANRMALDECLHQELERFRRHGRPLSAIMIDLDRFKQVNDTFGHVIGDKCLIQVVSRLSQGLRTNDLLARYGGEEFVVVLPETRAGEAQQVAEKLRGLIEGTEFVAKGDRLPVTVSLGVAQAQAQDEASELIGRADKAMYAAKKFGRNRVCLA